MAVLNKIRQRSVFLIVIIALALFSFVLADVIRSGGFTSTKSQNTIATINGNEISREDFARKVEAASRNYRGSTSTTQAVNSVWNQEVRSVLLNEQFDQLGIQIEGDQINDILSEALANDQRFQDEAGNYVEAKMKEYVAELKASSPAGYAQWLTYETDVIKRAKEGIYFNMVKAGLGATLKEGELAYKMENDKVDIKYVQLPYSTVADTEVEVSDAEIDAYVKKHPELYKAEASRNLRYVTFNEEPSAEDEAEVKEKIATLLNDKAEYNNATKVTDTVPGFKNTTATEEFVNSNSDEKYNDRFRFKKDLPAVAADTLYKLAVGDTYGPYKDGNSFKISKVVAQRQMADSVKASHILVAWKGLQTAKDGDTLRTKEQAKAIADSILNITKGNKEKFTEMAAQFSADASNKDKGGDLNYFTPGRMVPAFNDYVFDNTTGDMDIVETQFGYHVIRIDDQKNIQKVIKVGTIARKVEASEKTTDDVFRITTKFQIDAEASDFAEQAKKQEYSVKPVNKIKELDENIPGIGAQRSIVQWAFNEETKVGELKRFQIPTGYAVVQLTAKGSKGLMTSKDAGALVKPILLREKKAALLKSKISASTLDEIAKNQGSNVKTAAALTMKTPTIGGAGTEPKVVGTAFALEAGKVSTPIEGKNGVYIIEVTKKTPGDGLDTYQSYAAQATTSKTAGVNNQVFNALKEAAEIEDKRAKFY